jgi:protease-4
VGSIGVLMDGFGFVDGMKKIGVTRRLYTAGKYKGFMDPFSPENPDATKYIQTMLDSDHQVFINDVKQGRGSRLKDDPNLFSGLVWNGLQAKDLGLIDGFGSAEDIAREKYDNENVVDYTIKPTGFEKLLSKVGATFAHQFKMELFNPATQA